MFKNPDLLVKRLNVKETENVQKYVIAGTGIMFIIGFVLAGMNAREHWHDLPQWVVIAGIVVFLLSYGLFGEVLRENTYLSRVVEVQDNQKVIDTGLYGIVRHPMYMASLFLFLSMPLVLNSFYIFLVFLIYPYFISLRIKNEEAVLEEGLRGYRDYQKKVKYKVIPLIW